MEIVEGEIFGAESEIAVFVEPQGERIPVCDQKPLPQVELAPVDQHRLFWIW